jgi:CheY-like chemotaxis protein
LIEQQLPYILLVEDDCDDQAFFIECLGKAHPQVTVIVRGTGHEALSFLAACPPEDLPAAIVINYELSFLDGREILFLLAAVPRFASIPKVILSESDRHFWRCVSLGAKEYFVKACSVGEMDVIIGRVIALMEPA